jgi:hypothetical protein
VHLLKHLHYLFQQNLHLFGFLNINEHWLIVFVLQVKKQNDIKNDFYVIFLANFLGVFIGTVLPPIIVPQSDKIPLLVCIFLFKNIVLFLIDFI